MQAALKAVLENVLEIAESAGSDEEAQEQLARYRELLADPEKLKALVADLDHAPAREFAEGDYHGPESPGPGWVNVGEGPHHGKIWRHTGGTDSPEGSTSLPAHKITATLTDLHRSQEADTAPHWNRVREIDKRAAEIKAHPNRMKDRKLMQEGTKLTNERTGLIKKIIAAREVYKKQAHAALSAHVGEKADWQPVVRGKLDPDIAAVHKKGMAFIAAVVGKGAGLPKTAPVTKAVPEHEVQRSYCNRDGVSLALNATESTMVHEMGHWLDENVPGVLAASMAFLRQRVGDEPLTPLNKFGKSYRPDEKGRKDKFDLLFGEERAYYAGKDYGADGTEILSMGLEQLYNDPVSFAKKDPDFFAFVVGILDGTGRKAK